METLNKQTLLELSGQTDGPCISIYIPTHRKGRAVNEGYDKILFKNQVQKVKNQLQATDMRSNEVAQLLEPLEGLLDDEDFWHRQTEGLAVFRSRERFEYFHSPVPFEESLTVNSRFALRPLFMFLQSQQEYYILHVTQKRAALFRADRHSIQEVNAGGYFPAGIDEVLEPYEFENETQGLPQSKAGSMRGEASVYRGTKEENKMKDHLLGDYFRLINEGVKNLIGEEKKPLVLAAVEYYHPIYQQVNSYPFLRETGLTGNFDGTPLTEIHRMANELLGAYFTEVRDKRIAQYQNSSGGDLISHDLRHILESAVTGRVGTLFVRQNAQAWGQFDENTLAATIRDERKEGDESLVEQAMLLTLRNGGDVYLMDTVDFLPQPDDNAGVAALYRF